MHGRRAIAILSCTGRFGLELRVTVLLMTYPSTKGIRRDPDRWTAMDTAAPASSKVRDSAQAPTTAIATQLPP